VIAQVIGGRERRLVKVQVIGRRRTRCHFLLMGGKERHIVRIGAIGGKTRLPNTGVIDDRESQGFCVQDHW
jgi:hypothetical protein